MSWLKHNGRPILRNGLCGAGRLAPIIWSWAILPPMLLYVPDRFLPSYQ